jgi:hypothetical protein
MHFYFRYEHIQIVKFLLTNWLVKVIISITDYSDLGVIDYYIVIVKRINLVLLTKGEIEILEYFIFIR